MNKEQGQKISAAGATLLVVEPAMQLAHFGGPGVIVGLAAAGAAYLIADEIQKVKAGGNPSPATVPEKKPDTGKPSFGYRLLNGKSVRETEQPTKQTQPQEVTQAIEEEDEPMETLQPRARVVTSGLPRRSPKFAQMRHLIVPQSDILGFDGQQFVFADSLKQSVNVALIGVPGSGKTSCLTFHTAQAVLRNAIIRGWDLHGDVAADLGDCFNILEDVNDIVADCEWIQAERERRLTLRKRAKAGDSRAIQQWKQTRELFYIVDEFNALMLRLKQRKPDRELVADTLLSLIAEGRKFKMRCIIAGQTMPAALFGEGGSSARDIINTKYAFQSRENHAQYFGIESRAIENLLPTISGRDSAGYAILDGGPLLHAIIVSIPYTTVEDIRQLIDEGYGSQDNEEEDDLMGYMVGSTHYEQEERETEPLPMQTRRHVPMSAYEALQRRKTSRPTPAYAARAQETKQPERVYARVPEMVDEEFERGMQVYQAGARTLDAFQASMGFQKQHQARQLWARVKIAFQDTHTK